ncbi:MAG: DUF1566 domain-containing protein [Deltaproteobacteria bacterium]|nr:DUF1566 domain-containing protein [Deltaproteobacteria bacterium]
MNWEEALSYCATLNLGNYSDWRVPTIKELRSLADYSVRTPAINTTYFPNTVSSYYWSSTTYAYTTHGAWDVYFDDGNDRNQFKKTTPTSALFVVDKPAARRT